MICKVCGNEAEKGTRFCSQCGTAFGDEALGDATKAIPVVRDEPGFEDLLADDMETFEALAPRTALLIVRRGSGAGSRFLLNDDVTTIGRHPSSDIFLDDITVSRYHAKFIRTSTGFEVQDLGSLNGTYVNRVLLETSANLKMGDEVQVGKFRLVFYTGEHGMC